MKERDPHPDPALETAIDETVARLHSAGIDIDEDCAPADLARLLDAVEEFEAAVRARGGDLMVDEPPPGSSRTARRSKLQPDDPRFVVPSRAADETLGRYRTRILDAAEALRRGQ